jgi:hypothetical protein
MKQVSLNINGHPVVVKVSKWRKRPKANGIYIMIPVEDECRLSILKKSIEVMFNITINGYVKDKRTHGLYIPEDDAASLEEGIIILALKDAEARGWLED